MNDYIANELEEKKTLVSMYAGMLDRIIINNIRHLTYFEDGGDPDMMNFNNELVDALRKLNQIHARLCGIGA